MLSERRKALHERIGDAIESLYSDRLDDHLGEMAYHYRESNNAVKAARYLGMAAEQALRRSLHTEAIVHAMTGLSLLERISDEPERLRAELALQLVVGRASIATVGYTSKAVQEAFSRAAQICQKTNSKLGAFSALGGLFAVHFVRAEIGVAHELAIQALRIAKQEPPGNLLVDAHMCVGAALFWLGRNAEGLAHSKWAVSAYRSTEPLPNFVNHDGLAMAFLYQAFAQWSMGYADSALELATRSVERAEFVAHPHTVALMRVLSFELQWYRRDRLSEEQARDLIAYSETQGLPYPYGLGVIYHSIALLERGSAKDALADLSQMVERWTADHSNLNLAQARAALAQAYAEQGELEKGLIVINEALEQLSHSLQRQMGPEFRRIKGELLLKNPKYDAGLADDCFRMAIRVARKQSAKSWELRATMSLARLLARRGRRDEARRMLAAIYHWFTQGFDTADLKDARALLEQLDP
jgi:tetratricopeptide (TPR) repeat protein